MNVTLDISTIMSTISILVMSFFIWVVKRHIKATDDSRKDLDKLYLIMTALLSEHNKNHLDAQVCISHVLKKNDSNKD